MLLLNRTLSVLRLCCRVPHVDPDETSRLFKRPGERLLLWKMLEAENPWAISGQVARRHRWARIAEKIMKPCYLVVYEQGGGKTTKKLDVCKNSDVTVEGLVTKIKRMWVRAKKKFLVAERAALAGTGGETRSAKADCAEGDDREFSCLAATVRLCEFSIEERRLNPAVNRTLRESAIATRELSVRRMLAEDADSTDRRSGGRDTLRGGGRGSGSGGGDLGGGRGGRGGERGGRKRSRDLAHHVGDPGKGSVEGGGTNEGMGLPEEYIMGEYPEDSVEDVSWSDDESSGIEMRDDHAQGLAGGHRGRQVRRGAGGGKTRPLTGIGDGVEAQLLMAQVTRRLLQKMDDDSAVNRAIRQRLDQLAAEQAAMKATLEEILQVVTNNRQTPAAPPPVMAAAAASAPPLWSSRALHPNHAYMMEAARGDGQAGAAAPGGPMASGGGPGPQ